MEEQIERLLDQYKVQTSQQSDAEATDLLVANLSISTVKACQTLPVDSIQLPAVRCLHVDLPSSSPPFPQVELLSFLEHAESDHSIWKLPLPSTLITQDGGHLLFMLLSNECINLEPYHSQLLSYFATIRPSPLPTETSLEQLGHDVIENAVGLLLS